jgi:hypothetical protein
MAKCRIGLHQQTQEAAGGHKSGQGAKVGGEIYTRLKIQDSGKHKGGQTKGSLVRHQVRSWPSNKLHNPAQHYNLSKHHK